MKTYKPSGPGRWNWTPVDKIQVPRLGLESCICSTGGLAIGGREADLVVACREVLR
jgi:hypothetical protein